MLLTTSLRDTGQMCMLLMQANQGSNNEYHGINFVKSIESRLPELGPYNLIGDE